MVVETASDVSGWNAASVGSMLVFADGTCLCDGSADYTFYVFLKTAVVESNREETLDFSISNTDITAFDQTQSWQVWSGSNKMAKVDTFAVSEKGLVLSGKLVDHNSRLWKGYTLKLVSEDEKTTYDFGILVDLEPGDRSLLATALGQNVPGFSEDVPEPYSSSADITGDSVVGAVDYVIFSSAWMFRKGDASWNSRCDFNRNGDRRRRRLRVHLPGVGLEGRERHGLTVGAGTGH